MVFRTRNACRTSSRNVGWTFQLPNIKFIVCPAVQPHRLERNAQGSLLGTGRETGNFELHPALAKASPNFRRTSDHLSVATGIYKRTLKSLLGSQYVGKNRFTNASKISEVS